MNIQTFQLFCYAVEEKSISGAAKRAYLSQPAATKKIRQLEEHYSSALFERDHTPLVLTPAGERLFDYARAIIKEYNESIDAITTLRNKKEQTLRIGSSYTLGEYVLPEIISAYQNKNPFVHIKLSINNTPSILTNLEDRVIDIAFVEGDLSDSSFDTKVIAHDRIIMIVSRDHPWAEQHIVPRDLVKERLIRREDSSATRQIIETHLSERINIKEFKNTLELSTTQAIKNAVLSGLGYGFVSRLAVRQELKAELLSEVHLSGVTIQRPLWRARSIQRFPKESISQFDSFVSCFLRKNND